MNWSVIVSNQEKTLEICIHYHCTPFIRVIKGERKLTITPIVSKIPYSEIANSIFLWHFNFCSNKCNVPLQSEQLRENYKKFRFYRRNFVRTFRNRIKSDDVIFVIGVVMNKPKHFVQNVIFVWKIIQLMFA